MFTYWHMHNLRGSVLSKIPLGCFSQREPAAEHCPHPEDVCVCVCVNMCCILIFVTYHGPFGSLTHHLLGRVMDKGYVLAGIGAFLRLLQLARVVGLQIKVSISLCSVIADGVNLFLTRCQWGRRGFCPFFWVKWLFIVSWGEPGTVWIFRSHQTWLNSFLCCLPFLHNLLSSKTPTSFHYSCGLFPPLPSFSSFLTYFELIFLQISFFVQQLHIHLLILPTFNKEHGGNI